MESLYTKYRPQTFADVVGQTHVVTTLEHAVLEGRTSHAYLFCGPRGTGKTTMARLLAKALMCEQGEGHLPDGSCEQCRLIAAGEHPDVYELDAASRTGVDNVREEIISRVSFAPVRGRYKMYIIDEVHMLTAAAFNALLKTLEEPPSHVVFVLCTTDPQKIPETILSRVQRFDFHSIGNADIQARLAYICEREGFSYDPEALELVVRHARGGMRDAISELEQLSVSGGGTVSVDVARDVLGEVSASTLERMCLAMANRDVPTLFAQVEGLVEVGRDLLQFTRALASRLRDVYVVAVIGAKSASVSAAEADLPAISREAKAFGSHDRIARALQLLSDASTEMRVAPNQRLVLEVALTKIARPQAELTLEALADRVATLERQVTALSAPSARRVEQVDPTSKSQQQAEPVRTTETKTVSSETKPAQGVGQTETESFGVGQAPRAQAPSVQSSVSATTTGRTDAAATAPRVVTTSAQPASAQTQAASQAVSTWNQPAQAKPQAAPTSQVSAPVPSEVAPAAAGPGEVQGTTPISDAGELQRRWKQVVEGLRATHPQHGSLLLHATLVSDDGNQLLVSLPKGSGFACKMLERNDVRAHVDPAIAQVFGPRKTHFAEADVIETIMARRGDVSRLGSTAPAGAVQQPLPATPPVSQAQAPRADQSTSQAPVKSSAVQANSNPSVSQVPVNPPVVQDRPAEPLPQTTRSSARQTTTAVPSTGAQPTHSDGRTRQTTPSYPAPWEPLPYDDDQVPYDDIDVAPYEEDFIFGTVDPAQMAPFGSRPNAATSSFGAPRQPAPIREQVQAIAPQTTPPLTTVPSAQTESELQPARQPQERVAPEAPAWERAPEPTPEPKPEPTPDSSPQSTEATPTADEAVEAPKRKRSSRQTGGVPNDIIALLSKVFGEGITYTEVAPDEERPEAEMEVEVEAEVETAESFVEETYAGDGTEDGFVDEPLDDADYEDEE